MVFCVQVGLGGATGSTAGADSTQGAQPAAAPAALGKEGTTTAPAAAADLGSVVQEAEQRAVTVRTAGVESAPCGVHTEGHAGSIYYATFMLVMQGTIILQL